MDAGGMVPEVSGFPKKLSDLRPEISILSHRSENSEHMSSGC